MRAGTGNTLSLWQATAKLPAYEPLRESANTDVVIIGAGIAGLSCAHALARAGRQVIVIDDGEIGSGETARTSAHLASGLDDRYYEIERLHGAEGAQLAAASHAAAIAQIEKIVRDEQIACDFMRVPGLLIPGTNAAPDELEREHAATKRAGLDTDSLDDFRFGERLKTSALRFADQAQFHPLRYLDGLAQACTRAGVHIHTHTRAREVHGGKQATVKLDDGSELRCNAIVVATNSPFNDRVAIHTKQAAYRTFVIAIHADAELDACLIWDTEDPYHYVRTWRDEQNNATWLIVGGEDHKTGQPEDERGAFSRLHDWTRERLGIDGDVDYAWSGQIIEPNDGLAFIGRNPMDADNVFIVTGDSGNGLTHGTIASMLLTDLIEGRSNPWTELYSPSRRHGAGEFIRENANVAAQYAELATGGDAPNVEDIAANAGAVVRKGLHKIAAFRDADGVLHAHAATCTHLGCIVHWNSVEKTWDCPCHGSRFDPVDGHVLNGPAAGPLRAVDDDQTH